MHRISRLTVVCLASIPALASARPPAGLEFDAVSRAHEKRAPTEPGRALEPEAAAAVTQPGEDVGSAIFLPSLPALVSGSSCGFRDDLAPVCTFLGAAPDVVYAYVPPADVCVDVDLCASGYDTALLVLDGGPDSTLACDDDGCGRASRLLHLPLVGGHTYYFVIDGWYGACGNYVLDVHECPPPCPIDVPTGALEEGEPVCADGYYDHYNTGCNDWPYRFTPLPCASDGVTVRGTYGTWRYYSERFRDTDWYEIVVDQPARLDYRVEGGAATQIAILDGTNGCTWEVVCGSEFGAACKAVDCDAMVPPGTYWLFVAPSTFQGVPCGTPYVLTLLGHPCASVGVAPIDWGQIKEMYR